MSKKIFNNSFHEGLSSDLNYLVEGNTSYTDAENVVLMPNGGDSFILQNLRGNEIAAFLPQGHIPRAIKVYNNIAYIISSMYSEDGTYQYTEIGTYPSPNWDVLNAENMELEVVAVGINEVVQESVTYNQSTTSGNLEHETEEIWAMTFDSFVANKNLADNQTLDAAFTDTLECSPFDCHINNGNGRDIRVIQNVSTDNNHNYFYHEISDYLSGGINAGSTLSYQLTFFDLPINGLFSDIISGYKDSSKDELMVDILRYDSDKRDGYNHDLVLNTGFSLYNCYFKKATANVLTAREWNSNISNSAYADQSLVLGFDGVSERDQGRAIYKALSLRNFSFDPATGIGDYSEGDNYLRKQYASTKSKWVFVFRYKGSQRMEFKKDSFKAKVRVQTVIVTPANSHYTEYEGMLEPTSGSLQFSPYYNSITEITLTNLDSRAYSNAASHVNYNRINDYEHFVPNMYIDQDTHYYWHWSGHNGALVHPVSFPRLMYKRIRYNIQSSVAEPCGFGMSSRGDYRFIGVNAFPAYVKYLENQDVEPTTFWQEIYGSYLSHHEYSQRATHILNDSGVVYVNHNQYTQSSGLNYSKRMFILKIPNSLGFLDIALFNEELRDNDNASVYLYPFKNTLSTTLPSGTSDDVKFAHGFGYIGYNMLSSWENIRPLYDHVRTNSSNSTSEEAYSNEHKRSQLHNVGLDLILRLVHEKFLLVDYCYNASDASLQGMTYACPYDNSETFINYYSGWTDLKRYKTNFYNRNPYIANNELNRTESGLSCMNACISQYINSVDATNTDLDQILPSSTFISEYVHNYLLTQGIDIDITGNANTVILVSGCEFNGSKYSANTSFQPVSCCSGIFNVYAKLTIALLGNRLSEGDQFVVSNPYLIGNSYIYTINETDASDGTVDIELLFNNVPLNQSAGNIDLNLTFTFSDNIALNNLSFDASSRYSCIKNNTSNVEWCYKPLHNFTNGFVNTDNDDIDDTQLSDIQLIGTNYYNEPFRSSHLIIDRHQPIDLLLQPHYDSTINLIINDGLSKLKMINSRISYDPLTKEFRVPQNDGRNDNNVYTEQHPNRMELILRSEKVMKVELNGVFAGGKVLAGAYIFFFRYIDADGNKTDIEAHTLKVNAVNISQGIYMGENPGKETNSKFSFRLSNIDKTYSYINVSFMLIAGELNPSESYYELTNTIPIKLEDFVDFEYTGLEQVTQREGSAISYSYNHHKSIGSIEQSRNVLANADIRIPEIKMYEDIQRIAVETLYIEENNDPQHTGDFYGNPNSAYGNEGYWRGETYQIRFGLKLINGGETPLFSPRGLDNMDGNATYTFESNNYIDDFVGLFSENPYGIYRTNLKQPIFIDSEDEFGGYRYILKLNIKGFDAFFQKLEEADIKKYIKGVVIYRAERIKDAVIQGYISPTTKIEFGVGVSAEDPSGSGAVTYKAQNDLDNGSGPSVCSCTFVNQDIYENVISGAVDDENTSHGSDELKIKQRQGYIVAAPFRMMQIYYQSDSVDDEMYNVPHLYGTAKPSATRFTTLLKQKYENKRFAFISGDMNVDAEHIAAEFNNSPKYFMVSQNPTYLSFGWSTVGNLGAAQAIYGDDGNTGGYNIARMLKRSYINDVVASFLNTRTTGVCETYYIPEKSISNTDNFFATKVDKTHLNFTTCAIIGAVETANSGSYVANSSIAQSINEEVPYGLLSNIYNNSGPLSKSNWQSVYRNVKNTGSYFPVSHIIDINGINDDLEFGGGDCFVSKTFMKVIYKNGLDDNFDNYSDLWDYVGTPGSRDFMNRKFDIRKDNPAAESWFTDSSYTMLQRARLVPKGLWVQVYHESNFNLELRSSQFKTPEERAIFGKDRLFLSSEVNADAYMSQEVKSSQLETKNHNKGYSSGNSILRNYPVMDFEKILTTFYSRIEVSQVHADLVLKNRYREFLGLNYRDYDTKYGVITKIIEFNNELYCIQERAISQVPLYEKSMASDSYGGVYTLQKDALGPVLTVINNSYGSIHKDSIINTKSGIYLFDYNNMAIINVSGQGAQDISSYKIERFIYSFIRKFNALGSGYRLNVKANYNELSGDITFTFYVTGELLGEAISCSIADDDYTGLTAINIPDEEYECSLEGITEIPITPANVEAIYTDNEGNDLYAMTLYYNERYQKWVSRLTYHPDFEFTIANKTYSFNLVKNRNRIYAHNSENVNFCFFYDSQHTFNFEFVINKENYYQKILDNLMVISNRRIPIFIRYNMDDKYQIDTLTKYDIDSREAIKTRRQELKVIGIAINDYFYLNALNVNPSDVVGSEYTNDSVTFKILSMATDPLLDGTIYSGLSKLTIQYSIDNGTSWTILDSNSIYYEKAFGITFKINKISILRFNADYVEDMLYIQVQSEHELDIRDKYFKVKVEYDGMDHTTVHGIITNARMSFN